MKLWLGTHEPTWLARFAVPMMVSRRRLTRRNPRTYPRALAPWVLDSGGFTELHLHGTWELSADAYVAQVARFADEVGNLAWAAPQDWMVEASVLARTGLTVREHQTRTVRNFLELDGRGPFVPVLQGWTMADYLHHVDEYAAAGVDLAARPLIGVGTLCRRSRETEVIRIADRLTHEGLTLHGFGVKRAALNNAAAHVFASCDSMAWSYRARRARPLAGCTHKSCSNCARFALQWYGDTLRKLDGSATYQRELAL